MAAERGRGGRRERRLRGCGAFRSCRNWVTTASSGFSGFIDASAYALYNAIMNTGATNKILYTRQNAENRFSINNK